jgi:hypothetical protein
MNQTCVNPERTLKLAGLYLFKGSGLKKECGWEKYGSCSYFLASV